MTRLLRRGLRLLPALALPLTLGACDIFGPGDNTLTRDQLDHYEGIWKTRALVEYSMVVARGGTFDDAPRAVRLHVINNVIQSATYADDGTAVDAAVRAEHQTVDQMFAFVRQSINRRPVSFSVNYDETYGYPSLVLIDFDARRTDDDVLIAVEAFSAGGG
jgi:hypothetical protein